MGILNSFTDSLSGTLADQWKEVITAGRFDEHLVVAPGILQNSNKGRGVNHKGSVGVISNGSIIRIPESTSAFIFSQSGIEQVITVAGEFIYKDGTASLLDGSSFTNSISNEIKKRFTFGGQPSVEKKVSFVNLREIRGIRFSTKMPILYHDKSYDTDLEILARGSLSLQVTDPELFIKSFVPTNVSFYSFDDKAAQEQIIAEFMQSFSKVVTNLSKEYRISEIASQSDEIMSQILDSNSDAGSWEKRFGFKLISVAVENIELSKDSRELVKNFSSHRMQVDAYENTSQKASNILAQQKVASGVEEKGFEGVTGMVMGVNMIHDLSTQIAAPKSNTFTNLTLDEQVNSLKKFKELLDEGILTEEEFNRKKREILEHRGE